MIHKMADTTMGGKQLLTKKRTCSNMRNSLCTVHVKKSFQFGSVSFCLVLNFVPFCLRVGKQKEAFNKAQIEENAIHTMTRVLAWIRIVHVHT